MMNYDEQKPKTATKKEWKKPSLNVLSVTNTLTGDPLAMEGEIVQVGPITFKVATDGISPTLS